MLFSPAGMALKKNDSWTKPTTVSWRPRAINISREIDMLASVLSTWSQEQTPCYETYWRK